MDWESPYLLLLIFPALAFLLWAESKSSHPMPAGRKRILLIVRALAVMLALAALAGPARVMTTARHAVIFVLDQSQSIGAEGLKKETAKLREIESTLPADTDVFYTGLGDESHLLTAR